MMKKRTNSSHKVLQEILNSQQFERLESVQESIQWEGMTDHERELLAKLFVKAGEKQLSEGKNEANKFFQIASRVAPFSEEVYYRQAEVYASYPDTISSLISACRQLKKATDLNPTFFDAFFLWGQVLMRLGSVRGDPSHYASANEKYRTAEELISDDMSRRGELLWYWGKLWLHWTKHSGEAYDCSKALEKLIEAEQCGCCLPEFWNDYANAYRGMGRYLGNVACFFDAIRLLKRAVSQAPHYFEGWANLACTIKLLYEKTGKEKFFLESFECFTKAARLNSSSFDLWLTWGQLLANSGKMKRNHKRLELSLRKFAIAKRCQPDNSVVYCLWGDTLIHLGALTESHDMLRHGEKNILESLQLSPDNSVAWYCYGTALNELGKYFDDIHYFHEAIEKFTYGQTLRESTALFSYGVALSYLAMGEMEQDSVVLERAVQHFQHALDSGEQLTNGFWSDWGVTYMRLGELLGSKEYFDKAVASFERIIDSTTEFAGDPEWLYHYGCALDSLGEMTSEEQYYEQAVQALTTVLTLDPTHYDSCYNLAVALTHLGEAASELDYYFKAIELFQFVINKDNEDDMAWNEWGMTLLNVAQIVKDPAYPDTQKQFREEAEEKLLRSASLGNVSALYNLASLYSLTGQYEASVYYLGRSAENGGLPPIEEVMNDEWMDNVSTTQVFKEFLRGLPEDML